MSSQEDPERKHHQPRPTRHGFAKQQFGFNGFHRQFSLLLRLVPNALWRWLGNELRIVPKVLRKVEGFHVAINEQHRRNGLLGEILEIASRYLAAGVMPQVQIEAVEILPRKSRQVVNQDVAGRLWDPALWLCRETVYLVGRAESRARPRVGVVFVTRAEICELVFGGRGKGRPR